jgi:hypothetical protein
LVEFLEVIVEKRELRYEKDTLFGVKRDTF